MALEADFRELIAQRYSDDEARWLMLFGERLFMRESAADAARAPAERLEILASAFDFYQKRIAPIMVRAFAGRNAATIVETLSDDCPFIVDSILEYFRARGIEVRSMLHPIVHAARDDAGNLVSLETAAARETAESFMHIELEAPADEEETVRLTREIEATLVEVRRATADFSRMTDKALEICSETASIRELVEVRDFLRWMVQGGFVFLGYRRYRVENRNRSRVLAPDLVSGLGILADYESARFAPNGELDQFTPAELKLLFEGPALIAGKLGFESHVHRWAPMDAVMIRRVSSVGSITGFDRFIGLYTSKAYAEEAEHIPLLRAKLADIIRAERVTPGSHDFKQIVAAFNSLPKEELFRAQSEEIRAQLKLLVDLQTEAAVRLSIVADPARGHVIALVAIPREAFSPQVRQKIQNHLEQRLGGSVIYYHLSLGEGLIASLHFCFAAQPPSVSLIHDLENEVVEIARTWNDRLREQIFSHYGPARGHGVLERWGLAFDDEYKAGVDPEHALADVVSLEALVDSGGFDVNFEPGPSGTGGALRMLAMGKPPALSELMPMLQNFALRILSEDAHRLTPLIEGKPGDASVQSFTIELPTAHAVAQRVDSARFNDAIKAVHAGKAEDDALNALVLTAGLGWRQVALIRALVAAATQMDLALSRAAAIRVLVANPSLARILAELFAIRLDPNRYDVSAATELRNRYIAELARVQSIADDRFARSMLSLVVAAVRTNYFRDDPYITIKFATSAIQNLRESAPMFEIHVNSPRMEGCHLRAGRIARGGIRYSDRPFDYRTEILDLMKTQTVKNAVIVPTGAKGGFVVKTAAGASASPEDVVAAYRTLMCAMLDVTDNLTDNGVVHPAGVKALDGDDPYLVVAADKGTAAFSDIANEIAVSHGFWLGDAFASGGEHGYDHKKIGITARGAWESAKQHLREMGRDLAHGAPVTMVGIGDMSGDVFGNGLVYSNNVRLIAAFDHRHIFIDPDPDPNLSFEERRRLFATARSCWADYNPALLSAGGLVVARGQKRIDLAPQARAALGIEDAALDGESLIRAILRAPVEMIYNGGIGTYVRASGETDAEVGDHANDSCRIAASELRTKIVVEGGNLGLTQRARIEYALAGGRINTDSIDNSAGVDTSDHEVNLKILLEPAIKRGALTFDQRNRVLAECEGEIATSVLEDNRDQALLLSLEQTRSRTELLAFREHMQAIEDRGVLRRHDAALPSQAVLRERRTRYPGLTRPELALVTAHTKIDLVAQMEAAPQLDDPYLIGRFLEPYFPAPIPEKFAEDIAHHRLRREIIATRIANEMVDLMGSTFVFAMTTEHGARIEDAVRAWIIASDVIDLDRYASELREGDSMLATSEGRISALLELANAGRAASVWILENRREGAIGCTVDRLRVPFRDLCSALDEMISGGERAQFDATYRALRSAVGREECAHWMARLAFSDRILDALNLGLLRGSEPRAAADIYFKLADAIDFGTLGAALKSIAGDDRWERRAARELSAELSHARVAIANWVVEKNHPVRQALEKIRMAREREFADATAVVNDVRSMPAVTLAALQVAVRAVSRLARAL